MTASRQHGIGYGIGMLAGSRRHGRDRPGTPCGGRCGVGIAVRSLSQRRSLVGRADGADLAAAHGLAADGGLLVCPDGFVAWRSPTATADPTAELDHVLRATLSR
jgi:putative polyketide hydroxylase